jgi:hypothetical protein
MTTPGLDQDGGNPDIQTLARDVERLHQLTHPYVTEGDDDLSQAVGRIPDATMRREAGELLRRVKSLRGSSMDGLAR